MLKQLKLMAQTAVQDQTDETTAQDTPQAAQDASEAVQHDRTAGHATHQTTPPADGGDHRAAAGPAAPAPVEDSRDLVAKEPTAAQELMAEMAARAEAARAKDAARAAANTQRIHEAFTDSTLTDDHQRVLAAFADHGLRANKASTAAAQHHQDADADQQPDPIGPLHPDTVVVQDQPGNLITAAEINELDGLTPAQRAGAIILGALYSVMSMHPDDAATKRAHGTPAKLVIVQDIQTAHHSLGLPQLPEAVRRPTGPDGIIPAVIQRPNPHNTNQHNDDGEGFDGYANPAPWTAYQSEIVNVGPIHPAHAHVMLCDVELVGQIWNGQDIVLNEYRTKRFFTTAQRNAILARDQGCQAPGCSLPGTYCQIHHDQDWSQNGDTNENNAITLCSRHHADIHNGKWIIRKIDGLTFFQPAPWLDPTQPLLRNLYWNI